MGEFFLASNPLTDSFIRIDGDLIQGAGAGGRRWQAVVLGNISGLGAVLSSSFLSLRVQIL